MKMLEASLLAAGYAVGGMAFYAALEGLREIRRRERALWARRPRRSMLRKFAAEGRVRL